MEEFIKNSESFNIEQFKKVCETLHKFLNHRNVTNMHYLLDLSKDKFFNFVEFEVNKNNLSIDDCKYIRKALQDKKSERSDFLIQKLNVYESEYWKNSLPNAPNHEIILDEIKEKIQISK